MAFIRAAQLEIQEQGFWYRDVADHILPHAPNPSVWMSPSLTCPSPGLYGTNRRSTAAADRMWERG